MVLLLLGDMMIVLTMEVFRCICWRFYDRFPLDEASVEHSIMKDVC